MIAPDVQKPIRQSAGDIVATALKAEGVEVAFGLVGSHLLGIYESLRTQTWLRHVTIRHETNAGFMVHAYSILSGKTSVVFTTAGPGVLNALGAIGHCHFQAVGIVMISGGVPTHGLREDVHGAQSTDFTRRAAAQVTKAAYRVESVAALPATLAQAFQLARSGRPGPVYVEIPWNLSQSLPTSAPSYQRLRTESVMGCPEDCAARVLDAIESSARVVFCIDRCAVRYGQHRRIVTLAERIGAAITVSFDAIGAVRDDHPLYVGVANDFYFGSTAFRALQASDFALGFGLGRGSANEDFFYRLAGGAHFSFYTEDQPAEFGDGIACDLSSALDRLEERLEPRAATAGWLETGLEHRESCRVYAAAQITARPLHPGYVLSRVAAYLDSTMTVCLDVGANEVWAHSLLPVSGIHSHIGASNWAGMGSALPAMIGARLARPAARCLGICGDGGLSMSLGEYRTLLEMGGPCAMIIINDSAFGIIERFQLDRYGVGFATDLGQTDFASMARAFGGGALLARDPEELDAALAEAFSAREPVLIDVRTAAGLPFAPRMTSPVLTG
jgi:thiamine pyrophosphate-dependent acetolactate synthase large subunit-like protein